MSIALLDARTGRIFEVNLGPTPRFSVFGLPFQGVAFSRDDGMDTSGFSRLSAAARKAH
jgi:hypothetical protein